jgi:multiple sugar transport system permease protein
MVPGGVLAVLFTFYPMVMSWWYSLLNWTGFTSQQDFIGLDNYREVVHDGFFWDAFARSFLFMIVGMPVQLTLSLGVAILLNNQALKLAPVFRTCFFLPVVTSAAMVGIVFTLVLSPFHGPVNTALTDLGIIHTPFDFLGNPHSALWTVIGVNVWKGLGLSMIYWLAALQTVPRVHLEAAAVDGATRWQAIRHIMVPILIPFALIITLLTANGMLHVFALVQAMTGGGPYFATQVVEVYIYQTAFSTGISGGVPRLGYASAAGCFFGVAVLLITGAQLLVARKAHTMRAQLATGGDR